MTDETQQAPVELSQEDQAALAEVKAPWLPKAFDRCPNTESRKCNPENTLMVKCKKHLAITGMTADTTPMIPMQVMLPGPVANTQVTIGADVCLDCGAMFARLVIKQIVPAAAGQQVQMHKRRV